MSIVNVPSEAAPVELMGGSALGFHYRERRTYVRSGS
jgi:hypothetical protein